MSVDFSFGIWQIDDDHNFIGQLLAKLETDQDGPHAPELTGEVLADLYGHSFSHFNYEEALMQVTGFPDAQEHRQEHQEIIKCLNDLLEQSTTQSGQSLGHDIIEIINDGIIRHTDNLDREFSTWFSNKRWDTEDVERFKKLITAKDARPKRSQPDGADKSGAQS